MEQQTYRGRRPDATAVADLVAKALLILLLAGALFWPDLSGLKGKASTARLVVYPLGALAMPLWWLLAGRLRRARYPWAADLLVTLPWLLDLLGNRFDLFDAVGWWDDAMHFVNWALLTAGVLIGVAHPRTGRGQTVLAALGFGATAAIGWELGEYLAFIRHSTELQTAYTDTLGDLALGTLGSAVAGLVVHQVRTATAQAGPAPG